MSEPLEPFKADGKTPRCQGRIYDPKERIIYRRQCENAATVHHWCRRHAPVDMRAEKSK